MSKFRIVAKLKKKKGERVATRKCTVSVFLTSLLVVRSSNGPLQAVSSEEEVREEDQPEQACPVLDPPPHRQPHQVEREASSLAPHEAALLSTTKQ